MSGQIKRKRSDDAHFRVETYMKKPLTDALVYFVRAETGQFKIGFSFDVEKRFRSLSMSNPKPLQLWALRRAMDAELGNVERYYHERFGAYRLHGEWFMEHSSIWQEIAWLRGSVCGPRYARRTMLERGSLDPSAWFMNAKGIYDNIPAWKRAAKIASVHDA